jgi:hypothetical protein
MGGVEAAQAIDLHGNIIKLAAERRSKIRGMACFADILYGRTARESQFMPLEVAAE